MCLVQLRINRARQATSAKRFGPRPIATAITKECVRFLQVNRQGIVETGFDPGLLQSIPDAVAILTFDGITVPYTFAVGKRRRQLVGRILELFAVARGPTNTSRIPTV